MSEQTKHTPGPWRPESIFEDGRINGVGVGESSLICDCGFSGDEAEVAANARLIAAAPVMLELLRELIDIDGPQPGHAEWARKVNATIAKATGA